MKIRKIYHSFFFLRCKLSLNKAILLSLLKNFGYPLSEFNEFEYCNLYISSYVFIEYLILIFDSMFTLPKNSIKG